jgi:hypothetical protein
MSLSKYGPERNRPHVDENEDDLSNNNVENIHPYTPNNANNVRSGPVPSSRPEMDAYVKAVLESAKRFLRKKVEWSGEGSVEESVRAFAPLVQSALERNAAACEALETKPDDIEPDWTEIPDYANHIVQLFCKKAKDELDNPAEVARRYELFAASMNDGLALLVKRNAPRRRRTRRTRRARRSQTRRRRS